jgi:hypothetical protein
MVGVVSGMAGNAAEQCTMIPVPLSEAKGTGPIPKNFSRSFQEQGVKGRTGVEAHGPEAAKNVTIDQIFPLLRP